MCACVSLCLWLDGFLPASQDVASASTCVSTRSSPSSSLDAYSHLSRSDAPPAAPLRPEHRTVNTTPPPIPAPCSLRLCCTRLALFLTASQAAAGTFKCEQSGAERVEVSELNVWNRHWQIGFICFQFDVIPLFWGECRRLGLFSSKHCFSQNRTCFL